MFGKSILSIIFGPTRDEVTGEWRDVHNEKLHNSSLNIIRQVKSTRMRWAVYVACMEENKKGTRFWWENPWERDHSEDRGVEGRIESE
jgi:hypothetical protein